MEENTESRTCPLCPRKVVFADIESLKAHFELCQEDRPYRCDQCGLGFRAKLDLTKHRNTHNREEKSFSCSVCEKKFHFKSTLSIHERVHQKPKFICADCGRSFRTKPPLTVHCLEHLGLKPYKCRECQKVFHHANTNHQCQVSHSSNRFICANTELSSPVRRLY